MALTLERKKAVVEEVAEVARGALSAIAAEYRGLSVGEMTILRVSARSAGVYLRVVRNTLARRALEGTDFACMNDGLTGPLVLAFSREDQRAPEFLWTRRAWEFDVMALGCLVPSDSVRERRPGKRIAVKDRRRATSA